MHAKTSSRGALGLGALVLIATLPLAATPGASQEDKPYRITDGKVDWYTFSGFRRYHADCHVCHGPDGLGSSFAPALATTMKTYSYEDYTDVVVNGRRNVGAGKENVMPAFGNNPNVMCFIEDIYAYLKARADGALRRGRPKKEAKPVEARERDDACLGS